MSIYNGDIVEFREQISVLSYFSIILLFSDGNSLDKTNPTVERLYW